MKKLVIMGCFTYLLCGIGHIIIGTVLEPLIHYYGVSYSDGGQLIMNQFLGFLAGVLAAPAILKIIGRRITLFIALLLFASSQLSLFLLLPWNIMLWIIPLGGAGFGIMETLLAGMIIGALQDKKASIMTLTELFFGIGALAIPVVSAAFIATGHWNNIFAVVFVIILISCSLWTLLHFGQYEPLLKRQSQTEKTAHTAAKIRYPKTAWPVIFLGSLFFFLYVGVEMTFPNYLPSILSMTSDLSSSALALSITVFWGAMTFGRLLMILIIDRVDIRKLFFVTVFGQMIFLGLFALSPHIVFSYIVIFFAGLIMGGIFALGLLVVNEGIPGLEDRTTSLLIAMGGLGGAFLPKLAGSLLDTYPVTVTLWVLFGFAVLMTILMILIRKLSKQLALKLRQEAT
ncbi:MFS transporter [Gracilibacillus alcaliphilus]|uniref:MFS transporter n=1 Tax=Gracilibacillus alcaliphilus TaxID=1401441 RepID=UPI00195DE793|nr:MFS transporter [Gracilibacillus alcaliphilus]MBM7678509.1 FHS family glucose/mannose:H+ symporter-like MFS transporter [Gracilibacillus alcaliphilus]